MLHPDAIHSCRSQGAGGSTPSNFGQISCPVSSGGVDYAHHITMCPPPVFLNLPTALQVHTGSMVPTNILYSRFTCTLLTYVHIPSSYRVIFENYITNYFSTSKVSHISSLI